MNTFPSALDVVQAASRLQAGCKPAASTLQAGCKWAASLGWAVRQHESERSGAQGPSIGKLLFRFACLPSRAYLHTLAAGGL